MTKNKALIVITLSIILIAFVLFGIYFYFFKDSSNTGNTIKQKIEDYFPFGKPAQTNDTKGNFGSTSDKSELGLFTTNTNNETSVPVLRKISDEPVAGAIIYNKATTTYIRFVERGTGHIQETTIDSLNLTKVSNTTIPKIYEVVWGTSNNLLMRYLSENGSIKTYSAVIKEASTTDVKVGSVTGIFLPENIYFPLFSPTLQKLFYFSGNQGIIVDINSTKQKILTTSPFTDWVSMWPSRETLYYATKPSANIPGYAYTVNELNGVMTKIFSEINGLSILPNPQGTYVLYSESENKRISLNAFSVKKQTLVTVGVTTLPEKCAWSSILPVIYCAVPISLPQGDYPDDWYQGKISFKDSFWKINIETGETKLLQLGKNAPQLDGINLQLDRNEDILLFMNKKDNSLWSLKLTEN